LVAVVAVFGSVALVSGLVTSWVLGRQTLARRRVDALARPRSGHAVLEDLDLAERPDRVAQRLASIVPKSPKEMNRLRRRLARAGYRSLWPAVVYAFAEYGLPLATGLASVAYFGIHNRMGLLGSALLALLSFFVPGLILEHRITLRRKQIVNGLADALDLMVVCLEAGSSLDQSIIKATEELHLAYPALAEELRLLVTETRAGKARMEAFRNLADRTGIEDLRALVAMLVQTDRFGTSVSQALRVFAATARQKRRQRAEERAAKIGVKLVFPLVLFLFPALYVVILGPAVIQFVRVFLGQMMNK